LAFAAPGGAAAAAPTVQMMVVGAGNVVLSPARSVTVTSAGVQVGRRRCGALAATPLAALADLNRLGGPAFALHDYGRCGASPGSSGQLFVYSLDGERNHGQNGWEYKVDNRSGATGAGDPSGPQGDGHLLRSGQRLLWFWCASFAGGCQRTLALSAASTVARGAPLAVSVRGYDNDARATAMSGATVRLGQSFAESSAGRATLTAPSRPGRYTLSATRPGSVPAFPETIVVR
jgi:hypothetical protein